MDPTTFSCPHWIVVKAGRTSCVRSRAHVHTYIRTYIASRRCLLYFSLYLLKRDERGPLLRHTLCPVVHRRTRARVRVCVYVYTDYVATTVAKSSPRDRKKEQQFIAHDSGLPYACTTFRIILIVRANSSRLFQRVLLSLSFASVSQSARREESFGFRAGNQRSRLVSFDEVSVARVCQWLLFLASTFSMNIHVRMYVYARDKQQRVKSRSLLSAEQTLFGIRHTTRRVQRYETKIGTIVE